MEPVLVLDLTKAWSDEARAAAAAARNKGGQKFEDVVADIPPSDFEEGSVSVESLAEEHSKETGVDPKLLVDSLNEKGGSVKSMGQAWDHVQNGVHEIIGSNPDIKFDEENVHDSEMFYVYSESNNPETEKIIEQKAKDLIASAGHPGVSALGWQKGSKGRHFTIDVDGLRF